MFDFIRNQIICLNNQQTHSDSEKQEEQILIEEEFQVTNNHERLDNGRYRTDTEMKQEPKGNFNFINTSIVDQSFKKLISAIQMLSNKIEEKSNKIQERFQPVNIQLSNVLVNYLKEDELLKNMEKQEKLIVKQDNQSEVGERIQRTNDNSKKRKEKDKDTRKERNIEISNWLGVVCNKVFSAGFLLYKKDELKLQEVKAFCSENMLRNIISLSKESKLTPEDFKNIDDCLINELLPYFKSKYPETTESEVNMALSKQIQPIDNMESNDYDLIHKSGIKFEINEEANYNQDIMKFTNYVVEVPQTKIDPEKIQKIKEDESLDKDKKLKKVLIQQNQKQKEETKNQKNIFSCLKSIFTGQQNRQDQLNQPKSSQNKKQQEENKNDKTLFDCFEDKMNNYMKLICTRPQNRDSLHKPKSFENNQPQNRQNKVGGTINQKNYQKISLNNNQGNSNLNKNLHNSWSINEVKNNQNQSQEEREKKIDPETKQKMKEYQDRIRSFSHFEIGQKISKNFEKYSEIEMEELSFKFRNSAHIRVLTKWCEQLYRKFDEDYIMERQIPFRMKDGSQAYLDNNNLRLLWVFLQHEKAKIKQRLEQIDKNNHSLVIMQNCKIIILTFMFKFNYQQQT